MVQYYLGINLKKISFLFRSYIVLMLCFAAGKGWGQTGIPNTTPVTQNFDLRDTFGMVSVLLSIVVESDICVNESGFPVCWATDVMQKKDKRIKVIKVNFIKSFVGKADGYL